MRFFYSTHHSSNLQRTADFGQHVYKTTCLRNGLLILQEMNLINRIFIHLNTSIMKTTS